MLEFLLKAPIALLPVVTFLALLLHLESFRLVDFRTVVRMLLLGALLAAASYLLNSYLIDAMHFDIRGYSRYVAPIVEESLKAGVLVYLFARNRIGFMVDAAILGFAIGAGFALIENVYYLYSFPGANIGVWLVRGFGTAIMHGGATAIFGVMAQSLTNRHAKFNPLLYLPGLALAIALHGAFNNSADYPLLTTLITLLVLPLALFVVFAKSEHAVHHWLLTDYRSHQHLLSHIRSGEFQHSEAGRFILDLSGKFDEKVVADLFSYIQLHTELVLRIEKISLANDKGESVAITEADWEAFDRLHALEREIGKTALLVVWPHLQFSRKELWELYRVEHQLRHRHTGHAHPPAGHHQTHGSIWFAVGLRRNESAETR
jgi:RsiW-degrading membrane proteinase PrsW (M82 family)